MMCFIIKNKILFFLIIQILIFENSAKILSITNNSLLSIDAINLQTRLTRLRAPIDDGDQDNDYGIDIFKRAIDTTFRGSPKTREEMWHQYFNMSSTNTQIDQATSLVNLLNKIVEKYFGACAPIVFYDKYVEESDNIILQILFQKLQTPFIHGKLTDNYRIMNKNLLKSGDQLCRSYILFISDVLRTRDILGPQITNRVILIPRSTQWKLQEFLSSKLSSDIVNLLVIGESLSSMDKGGSDKPYILYTHRLYTDGLGSNIPIVLTSWINGRLTRPHVNLFPMKYSKGFAGHRFTLAVIHQPPFVIKKLSTDGAGNTNIDWDGLEIRLVKLLSSRLNFSYEFIEPIRKHSIGPSYGVVELLQKRRADIGVGGIYLTNERKELLDASVSHSRDCASFITLASKALPRYRAIMGPFQWAVWLSIVIIYLVAIFPLAFSDRLTLKHLIGNWGEIENMFWYVFGTFTNSLTFTGQFSWSNSQKMSTRLLIGCYWVFTIIITACYTGSIIAFVTLPIFPETVDSISDLISGFYRIGTFENDGWEYWFLNSTHSQTKKLLKSLEYVANAEEGLNNVTRAFFWPYAFLASQTQLDYIVQVNFTDDKVSKRNALHISNECFVPFGVSFLYPKHSVYAERLNDAILRFQQSGLVDKLMDTILWNLQKSSDGRLIKNKGKQKLKNASQEERGLTTADTEGMFLLMGIGYLIGASVFISEAVGGCAKKCREIARRGSVAFSLRSTSSVGLPNSSRKTSTSDGTQFYNANELIGVNESTNNNNNNNNDIDETLSNTRKNSLSNIDGNDDDLDHLRKMNIKHRRHNSLIALGNNNNNNNHRTLPLINITNDQILKSFVKSKSVDDVIVDDDNNDNNLNNIEVVADVHATDYDDDYYLSLPSDQHHPRLHVIEEFFGDKINLDE